MLVTYTRALKICLTNSYPKRLDLCHFSSFSGSDVNSSTSSLNLLLTVAYVQPKTTKYEWN